MIRYVVSIIKNQIGTLLSNCRVSIIKNQIGTLLSNYRVSIIKNQIGTLLSNCRVSIIKNQIYISVVEHLLGGWVDFESRTVKTEWT